QLHPILEVALTDIEYLFKQYNSPTVITSGWDGNHMPDSLHYKGKAIDLRIWYLDNAEFFAEALQIHLDRIYGHVFDSIFEPDHIHLEYDPRHA
ncbi:hypothetical protein LCGC14_1656110, partial [marine sediment metagenome]